MQKLTIKSKFIKAITLQNEKNGSYRGTTAVSTPSISQEYIIEATSELTAVERGRLQNSLIKNATKMNGFPRQITMMGIHDKPNCYRVVLIHDDK